MVMIRNTEEQEEDPQEWRKKRRKREREAFPKRGKCVWKNDCWKKEWNGMIEYLTFLELSLVLVLVLVLGLCILDLSAKKLKSFTMNVTSNVTC